MNRLIFVTVLLLAGMATTAMGQTTAPAGDADAAKLRATAAEQARKIHDLQGELDALKAQLAAVGAKPERFAGAKGLDQVVAEFAADRQPLETVLDRLGTTTELNVVVDWKSVEAQGEVKRNAPVSINVKEVTLAKLLDTLIALAGAPGRLDYEFDEQRTLLFSTGDAIAAHSVVTKMYDIRKLIPGAAGRTRMEKADAIIHNIESSVDASSWRDVGGSIGIIRELDGAIIVIATRRDHAAVAAWLKQQSEHH